MREQIDRALDLWDFDLVKILLSCSSYNEEYENFLYETGQFSCLKESSNYHSKTANISIESEEIDLVAFCNKTINDAICQNDLEAQRTYELFHKIKAQPCLLGKAYFISKIISYFATRDEASRLDFFMPLAMHSSPQNLLLQVLQKDFGKQEGAKKFFDFFVYEACLFLRKDISEQFLGSRVAVCFHGIFRGDFEGQINDTLDKLAKPLNADVFIFTWDKFQEWGGLCGGVSWSDRLLEKELSKNTPTEISMNENFRKFFPKTSSVLGYEYRTPLTNEMMRNFIKKNPCIKDYALENQDNKYLAWGEKIYYCMQKSFALMQEYENRHNIRYDFVIFARTDFEIIKSLSLEDLRRLDLDEICEEYGFYGTGSAFPYGRAEAMRHYVSLNENLEKLQCRFLTHLKDNHDTQAKWAMYFNLKTRNWEYETALYNRYAPSNIICLKGLKIPNIKKALKEDFALLRNNKQFDEEKLNEFEEFFDRFQRLYQPVSRKARKYVANQECPNVGKRCNIFKAIWKFFSKDKKC